MSTTETTLSGDGSFLRTAPVAAIDRKEGIAFDTVGHIDHDVDLGFQLRGHGYNPLVDGALPLFGLVIRLRKLSHYEGVERLYATVRDQISALDEEIRHHGYDSATQLAYRYALCSFVDEAVMSTPWGAHSRWAERSLLSVNHNETWGGEKFFTVLSRMMMDTGKYRDVLEFKYLCLCLGFKGKYGMQHSQTEALQAIIIKLHRQLRELRGESPDVLTDAQENIVSSRYRVGRLWPWWTPWLIVLILLAAAYAAFATSLGNTSELVLRSLDEILRK
ncbi:type IVB secretion system protein IcmH/DotU [Achromobacter spanius]|uniref:type IVB secretion system protein IcmH/DotU n=1 Tax=Achromobacter spanius TaxID=217203 RepID=UPI003207E184